MFVFFLYLCRYAEDTLSTCAAAASIYENIMIKGKDDNLKVQFMLDPSVIPEVISAAQIENNLLYKMLKVTTTWCYSLVKSRRKLLEQC